MLELELEWPGRGIPIVEAILDSQTQADLTAKITCADGVEITAHLIVQSAKLQKAVRAE